MKYMVMECHSSYAVVLDQDGRFLKVANMHYTPGQTVTDVVQMQLPQQEKKFGRRWIYSLAAVAACLVLLVTSVFVAGRMPYASVYMTINPQVRIDVNRSDIVVGLEGVNQDGQDLIQGYTYKKKDLDQVMDQLVDLAIEKGYLHAGGQIDLTLEANDEGWVVSHSDTLPEQLNTYLTDKITVEIQIRENLPEQSAPGQSDYDDTDYGSSDYFQTVELPTEEEEHHSDYDTAIDGQTDYGVSDYQQSQPEQSSKPVQPEEENSPYDDDDDEDDDEDDPSDYDED